MSTDMKNSIVLTTYYFEDKMAEARRWSAAWKKAAWKFRNKWQGDIRWVHAERNTNNQLRISNTRLKGERDEARDVARRLLRERDAWEYKHKLLVSKFKRLVDLNDAQKDEYHEAILVIADERDEARADNMSLRGVNNRLLEQQDTDAATIQHLESDRDALAADYGKVMAENAILRTALLMKEWDQGEANDYGKFEFYCVWCGNNQKYGHASDCIRQHALGLAKE